MPKPEIDDRILQGTDDEFLPNWEAYISMRDKLLLENEGRFVAFWDGKCVAMHDDKLQLIELVRKEKGPVRAFIHRIVRAEDEPKVMLPTSRRLLEWD